MAKGNICEKCQKNEATSLLEERGTKKKVCVECKEICEAWERNNPLLFANDKGIWDKLEDLKKAKSEMEPYLKKTELVESFGKSSEYDFSIMFGIGKQVSENNDPYCEQVKQFLGLTDEEKTKFTVVPDGKGFLIGFKKEEALRALEVLIKAYDWRINELTGKIPKPNRKPNKPNDKKDQPKSDETCERCKKSCKKLISMIKLKAKDTTKSLSNK